MPAANARALAAAACCPPAQRYWESFPPRSWLRPLEIKLRPTFAAVRHQRTLVADGVGALEDPILPGGEAAKDLGLERLRAGEAQVRLHAGQRIGRKGRARLDRHPHLVVPVDVVGRGEDEAGMEANLQIGRAHV